MIWIPYMRGAAAHEGQIGRLCYRLPFLKFLRVDCRPRVYLEPKED